MNLLNRFLRKSPPRLSSFAEALAACEGYQSPDLVRVVHEKTKRYRDNPDGKFFPALDGPNVIDFGGACGAHYFSAHRLRAGLRWHVVETPAMAKIAKDLEDGHLKFFDSLEKAAAEIGKIDLLFTSGALQYVPDPYATLRELCSLGARRMCITRLPLTSEHIISIQTSALRDNGPGPLPPGFRNASIRYPVAFMDRSLFEGILKEQYQIQEITLEEPKAYWFHGWIPMYRLSGSRS